jgi:hypothetical protein
MEHEDQLFYSGSAIDPVLAEISKSSKNSKLFASSSASNSTEVDPFVICRSLGLKSWL